jgi:AraC-like DNA-binding protein
MPNSIVRGFTDPYDYQQSVRAAEVEVYVTEPGRFRADLTRIDLHRLWMQRGSESLPRIAHAANVSSRAPIFFLSDDKQAPIVHSGMELAPNHLMFYSPGADHHHRTVAECRWGAMSLSPDDLAQAGRALTGHELTAPRQTRLIRPPQHLMSRLLGLHEAAGRLAATVSDILARPEVARAIEHELVRAMVACLVEDNTAGTEAPGHQRLSVMRRFERVLEENPDRPLHLTEICAAIGVSDRTLRLHCLEHLGISPHRYLWLRRMHQARRALAVTEAAVTNVTQIATDHGFWELGRFSVAYRKLFGESPSTTLRRAAADERLSEAAALHPSAHLPGLPG